MFELGNSDSMWPTQYPSTLGSLFNSDGQMWRYRSNGCGMRRVFLLMDVASLGFGSCVVRSLGKSMLWNQDARPDNRKCCHPAVVCRRGPLVVSNLLRNQLRSASPCRPSGVEATGRVDTLPAPLSIRVFHAPQALFAHEAGGVLQSHAVAHHRAVAHGLDHPSPLQRVAQPR